MFKFKFLSTSVAMLIGISVSFASGAFGTAEEAKAMLAKAVENITANEAGALAEMQKGGMGSRDRDLYVFCGQADTGVLTVHPTLAGKKLQDIVDKNGKKLGEEMMQVAKPGVMAEVTYFWPRPGADTTPVEKISFVTRAADQICGVGYYK
jgi:signal transduction histidine kinase